MFGSKDKLPKEVDTLLYHNYIIASIDYRLSNEEIFPAQIDDCKMAIQFLKANARRYQIDSSKIAVAGSSAGGHLAALVGTSSGKLEPQKIKIGLKKPSTRVQAVIDYYGPTDFLIMDILPENCVDAMQHSNINSPESRLLGCNILDCPEKVRIANPITYIDKNDPPFLIIHGKKDCTVTPQSSILLKKQLKKNKVPAELILIKDAEHGGDEFYEPELEAKVLDFLNKIFIKEEKIK
jgi:acetyl esterase/lipase